MPLFVLLGDNLVKQKDLCNQTEDEWKGVIEQEFWLDEKNDIEKKKAHNQIFYRASRPTIKQSY